MNDSIFSLPLTSPVALFGVVMLIITVAPILAKRVNLPGVVGIILLSAVIGPGALGVLERNDQVVLLGTVGLLYLIFAAGLSLDLNQFMRLKYRALTFGVLSFSFPMAIGYFGSRYLLGFDAAASVLIGSIVGTHTLLAYPVARLLGITKNRVVIMVVGATIITDALGLTMLAIVVKATAGDLDLMFWITFTLTMLFYVTAVLWSVPKIGRWFFRAFPNDANGEMAFSLAILFAVAMITDMLGLAPLIGAFLTGLALNRLIPSTGPLMSRIQFLGDALFVPFFLVSVGLLVDFRALFSSLSLWGATFVFITALYIGKFIASKACQLIYKYSNPESLVVFGLSTPQAAATLAVTLVGFDELGLFDVETVNAVVLMILATCIAGPMLVERHGREVASAADRDGGSEEEEPQRILVPLANPATAKGLMDIALAIRSENTEDPIYPLAVAAAGDDVYSEVAKAEKLLVPAISVGASAAVPVTPVTRVDVKPVDGIVRAIHELRISEVVIGWNGARSQRERIFGSILDQLLDSTSQLMMVCKLDLPLSTTERILLLVPPMSHRSPGNREALSTIKNLADNLKCDIHVITTKSERERMEKIIADIPPDVKVIYHTLGKWPSVVVAMKKLHQENDLITLLSAREKTIAWRPGLNRLPSLITTKVPEANFITVYPAEDIVPVGFMGGQAVPAFAIGSEDRAAPQLHPIFATLTDRSIRKRLPRKNATAVLRSMIRKRFSGGSSLKPTTEVKLIRKLMQFELELAPGVLLLHAPLAAVSEPVLLVGHSKEGLEFKGATSEIYLVFLLISPPGYPPDKHLANLSAMARVSSDPQLADIVGEAAGAEKLGRELNRILGESG
ncbi:MAG: cation:proton antiporter [Candidatus Sumerlaeia bacterium]|nr:cation:proton antiporter [Candidatus Sumerlaeia bacterium]